MRGFRKSLLSAALALQGSMFSAQVMAGDVVGTVVDAQGQWVNGAEVIVPALKIRRTTAADGSFYFANLPAGQYELEIRYLGAQAQRMSLLVSAEPVTLGRIQLKTIHDGVEHIEVRGQAGAINQALNRQRNALGIVTVASTDEMGQLPDSNVSEALQRLAGLSVERDQGEGRFVRVRGLAADYNAVTYNGTQLAAPEAGRRAVALDVIPADLLESIEVSKTLSPDMAAGSLGGTIEIKSLSAFDRPNDFYSMTLEGGHNAMFDQQSPKFAAVLSQRLSVQGEPDMVGVALAGSYSSRRFGSANSETGGEWDFAQGLAEFERRDYAITRDRLGLALNIDVRPRPNQDYFIRTLYSRFSDEENRQALAVAFADPVQAGQTAAAELTRSIKQREETQQIDALVLGTKQTVGAWQWQLEAGRSHADENTPFHIAGADFTQEFAKDIGYQGQQILTLQAPTAALLSDGYQLDEVEMADTYTEEQERNIKADLSREWHEAHGVLQLKAGVKISEREKNARESVWIFEDFADAGVSALSLSSYSVAPFRTPLPSIGDAIGAGAIYRLVHGLPADDYIDDVESAINDYAVTEDIRAGYVMAQWEALQWQIIAGVRYEHDARVAQGTKYDAVKDAFSANSATLNQGYWLPAVIARVDLNEQTIVRAALSSGLVRPTFAQLAPAYLLEDDDGDLEASFGNPQLKPLRSQNIDLGIEYYANGLGVLSAMAFYKSIDDFIYQADLAGRDNYSSFKKAETFINGDTATLSGIEFNAVHKVSGYQNWLDHLLISSNLTITDSQADIEFQSKKRWQARAIPLPSQSDRTANLTLGYESAQLNVRLAATYKSAYLTEVGELDDAAYDVYVDDHVQLDFSSKWQFKPHMQLYFNVINLTDEPYYAYSGLPQYNVQYERYGRTLVLGLQLSF